MKFFWLRFLVHKYLAYNIFTERLFHHVHMLSHHHAYQCYFLGWYFSQKSDQSYGWHGPRGSCNRWSLYRARARTDGPRQRMFPRCWRRLRPARSLTGWLYCWGSPSTRAETVRQTSDLKHQNKTPKQNSMEKGEAKNNTCQHRTRLGA